MRENQNPRRGREQRSEEIGDVGVNIRREGENFCGRLWKVRVRVTHGVVKNNAYLFYSASDLYNFPRKTVVKV